MIFNILYSAERSRKNNKIAIIETALLPVLIAILKYFILSERNTILLNITTF